MAIRCFLILIVFLIVSPSSLLHAVSMGGGMGSIGAMVDKISMDTKTVGNLDFRHSSHGTRCKECHPRLFKKKKNSNHVGMKLMEKGRSCGACHNGRRAFGVTSNCSSCHAGDVPIQTKTVGKTIFSHDVHAEMYGCDECHPDIFKPKNNSNHVTMKTMADGESCGACHDGDTAFGVNGDCVTCHAGDVLIKTKDVGKLTFSHAVHSDSFGCDECHPDLFKPRNNSNRTSMKAMANGESCGACHDGDMAFGVSGDCGSCHQGAKDVAIQSAVGETVFSHDVHAGMFGCSECHPDTFKAKANSNRVGMKKMEAGKSCGACHDGDTAFGVAEDCATCHAGAIDLEIQTKDVGFVPFSHSVHTEMFGCGECHPDTFKAKANSNQVGMKKMVAGESCGACHDGDTAFGVTGDCVSCHAGDIAYVNEDAGNIIFPHAAHLEMFGCGECHPDLFRAKRGANEATMESMEAGESCGACHDGDSAFGVAEDCESCHDM